MSEKREIEFADGLLPLLDFTPAAEWSFYAAAALVTAHPSLEALGSGRHSSEAELAEWAADVADHLLEERKKRFGG